MDRPRYPRKTGFTGTPVFCHKKIDSLSAIIALEFQREMLWIHKAFLLLRQRITSIISSMNSLLAVEKGLPPGLWLPKADEPTEQYLAENYYYKKRPYEDIVDYGSFVVALALLEQEHTGRMSLMPDHKDLSEMFSAGYGVSCKTLARNYGGVASLQRSLGFYPRKFIPSSDELLKRFQWIADYAYALDPTEGQLTNTEQIIHWGAIRDLTPSYDIVLKVLNGSTGSIHDMLEIREIDYSRNFTRLDVYRFGARVIAENGGPLSCDELNQKYKGQFGKKPYNVITRFFGTYSLFWYEFGYVPVARGLNESDIINIGVRHAITQDSTDLTKSDIALLSAQKVFPSSLPIRRLFGPISQYRAHVQAGFEEYVRLAQELTDQGITQDVIKAVSQRFESTPGFTDSIRSHALTLQKLSKDWPSAHYVLSIMQKGFNLMDETIMEMQLSDFASSLSKLGITSPVDRQFVVGLIPRTKGVNILTC